MSLYNCEWQEVDDEEYWESACGTAFVFNEDGPIENGFKYCPSCGKVLVIEPVPAHD